jgi:hypothetical protein
VLHPDAQALLDARAAERQARWDGRAPFSDPTARQITADVALIDVGWSIWSCRRVDADDEALGGIVVADLSADQVDADTGEVTLIRRWLTRNPFVVDQTDRRARRVITAAELVIPDGVEYRSRVTVTHLARRLAALLARRNDSAVNLAEVAAWDDLVALRPAVDA